MNKEREKLILEQLVKNKKVYVKDLAKTVYASEPSIRRDLKSLESQGLVKRIHGGAILEKTNNTAARIPFIIREYEQSDAKLIIAKKAAELVNDGDTIMLDGSSTAYNLIPFLSDKSNITVITNGVKALIKADEYGINAYSVGGKLLHGNQTLIGDLSHQIIESFNADICFFSCRGITEDGVLTDFTVEENIIRKKMITQSKISVFLCNSEKVGRKYLHTLCNINDISFIISDATLPEALSKKST